MKDIRIAAAIFNSPLNQVQYNLDRMVSWVSAAKKQDAAIVCFPELNVSGYSTRQDIQKSAEPIPGGASQNLVRMAREHQIVILAGLAEKDQTGKIFASHVIAAPDGISGVYRKLHIAPPERGIFSAGGQVPLFDIQGLRVGIQLCYDAHFPELSTRMAIEGADVIFMPHASPKGTPAEKMASWLRHLTARAFDNGIYIVACNQSGENKKGLSFPGAAVIIGPDGQTIAQDINGREGLIVTDLTSDALTHVREHPMRYFLPHRRPEMYAHGKGAQ